MWRDSGTEDESIELKGIASKGDDSVDYYGYKERIKEIVAML